MKSGVHVALNAERNRRCGTGSCAGPLGSLALLRAAAEDSERQGRGGDGQNPSAGSPIWAGSVAQLRLRGRQDRPPSEDWSTEPSDRAR